MAKKWFNAFLILGSLALPFSSQGLSVPDRFLMNGALSTVMRWKEIKKNGRKKGGLIEVDKMTTSYIEHRLYIDSNRMDECMTQETFSENIKKLKHQKQSCQIL
jgi:hypothetical protein